MLRAGCWLACFLVVAKALTPDLRWWPGLPSRLLIVLASSWSDALFALVCGGIGELALLAVRRWPRVAAVTRAGFLILFAFFAVFAVAAIGLFRYFHRPGTYNLLGLIGNAAAIRSSIAERMTLPIGLGLVLTPALYLALATRHARRRSTLIALAVVCIWIGSGWLIYRSGGWKRDNIEHLWLNPHTELLRTTWNRLTGSERPGFPKDFPPGYMDEFRPIADRQTPKQSFFQLPAGVARPRNAIVIVLESIGTKYLGLYGNPFDVTPTLSAEAKHALVFNNIYAHASFTYASFRPINFSVYPGLPWHYALLEDAGRPLPETLAGALAARGARTAYITSGDLYWGDQRWLLRRGQSFDLLQGASDLGCPLLSSWGTEDRCAIDGLLHWIDQKPAQPFFAVVWTDQTHDPYLLGPETAPLALPPDDARSPFAADLARYLAILHKTDAQLARVFALLRERNLADDTLVIITGDHGEAFGDPHGQRGHAWSVYEEEVHVPLMLWNPRLFPNGGRSNAIGGHVDLNPTMADLLGLPPPGEWQGHSLFDPARPERAYFMAIAGGNIFGVRDGDWKYLYDVTSGRELLFDLATDPKELKDVSAKEPARAKELRERVAAWVSFEDAYLWGREN